MEAIQGQAANRSATETGVPGFTSDPELARLAAENQAWIDNDGARTDTLPPTGLESQIAEERIGRRAYDDEVTRLHNKGQLSVHQDAKAASAEAVQAHRAEVDIVAAQIGATQHLAKGRWNEAVKALDGLYEDAKLNNDRSIFEDVWKQMDPEQHALYVAHRALVEAKAEAAKKAEAASAERLEATRAEMEGRDPAHKAGKGTEEYQGRHRGEQGEGGPAHKPDHVKPKAGSGGGGTQPPEGPKHPKGKKPEEAETQELLPAEVVDLANEIARLKKEGEGKIFKSSKGLKAAVEQMKMKLDKLAKSPQHRTQLSQYVNELITAKRVELADNKVKGLVATTGNLINRVTANIARSIKKHKKIAIVGLTVAGLAVAGGLTMGIAYGALPLMLAAAKAGAITGGSVGAARGWLSQRGHLAVANLKGNVQNRYFADGRAVENEGSWVNATQEFRKSKRNETYWGVGRQAIISSAAGALAAASAAGYVARFAQHAASGGEGAPTTGQEGATTPDAQPVDISEAAKLYPGRHAWDSYAHGLQKQGIPTNESTIYDGVLDGAHATQTAAQHVPGLKFGTWGKIDPGTLHPNGRIWGFKIKAVGYHGRGYDVVAPKAPNMHTVLPDTPKGGEILMHIKPGTNLGGSEQAALFDALNHGAKIVVSPEQAATGSIGNKLAEAIVASAKAGAGEAAKASVEAGSLSTTEAAIIGGAVGLISPKLGRDKNAPKPAPKSKTNRRATKPAPQSGNVPPAATQPNIRREIDVNAMANNAANAYNAAQDEKGKVAAVRQYFVTNTPTLSYMSSDQANAFINQLARNIGRSPAEIIDMLQEQEDEK